MERYNIIGYYPNCVGPNKWCLVRLGTNNKAQMEKRLEEIKANPKAFGEDPTKVTEFKLEHITAEENANAWWSQD